MSIRADEAMAGDVTWMGRTVQDREPYGEYQTLLHTLTPSGGERTEVWFNMVDITEEPPL